MQSGAGSEETVLDKMAKVEHLWRTNNMFVGMVFSKTNNPENEKANAVLI